MVIRVLCYGDSVAPGGAAQLQDCRLHAVILCCVRVVLRGVCCADVIALQLVGLPSFRTAGLMLVSAVICVLW